MLGGGMATLGIVVLCVEHYKVFGRKIPRVDPELFEVDPDTYEKPQIPRLEYQQAVDNRISRELVFGVETHDRISFLSPPKALKGCITKFSITCNSTHQELLRLLREPENTSVGVLQTFSLEDPESSNPENQTSDANFPGLVREHFRNTYFQPKRFESSSTVVHCRRSYLFEHDRQQVHEVGTAAIVAYDLRPGSPDRCHFEWGDNEQQPIRYELHFQKTLRYALQVMANKGYTHIVLEPMRFTSHAMLPPKVVSDLFQEILQNEFKNCFKEVVFVIKDPSHHSDFEYALELSNVDLDISEKPQISSPHPNMNSAASLHKTSFSITTSFHNVSSNWLDQESPPVWAQLTTPSQVDGFIKQQQCKPATSESSSIYFYRNVFVEENGKKRHRLQGNVITASYNLSPNNSDRAYFEWGDDRQQPISCKRHVKKTVQLALQAAIDQGYTRIVIEPMSLTSHVTLSPQVVSDLFSEILQNESKNCFQEVVFVIKDENHRSDFEKVFCVDSEFQCLF